MASSFFTDTLTPVQLDVLAIRLATAVNARWQPHPWKTSKRNQKRLTDPQAVDLLDYGVDVRDPEAAIAMAAQDLKNYRATVVPSVNLAVISARAAVGNVRLSLVSVETFLQPGRSIVKMRIYAV